MEDRKSKGSRASDLPYPSKKDDGVQARRGNCMERSWKQMKGVKRVTEISTESAKSIKGGKSCSCSCQTKNEEAATTLKTFTA